MEQAGIEQFREEREAVGPAVSAMTVDIRAAGEIDRAGWQRLVDNAADPNPFCERWFLQPSIANLADPGRVAILCCASGSEIFGLLPVERRLSYDRYPIPHWASWLHDHAFCGAPLIRAGFEQAFWSTVLEWLDAHAGPALFFHLHCLPTDTTAYAALRDIVAEQRRPAAQVHAGERALLRSDLEPEVYFAASMSAKKRKELRRQYNRLSEQGELSFERRTDGDGLDRWVAAYLELESAGWKGRNGSALAQSGPARRFFRDAMQGAAQAGRLERIALTLDGRPIAMLANFLTPPGAYSFKTAYDERLSRYSPGVLLQRENLDLLGREDVAWADSCAASDHPMIERIWREKREVARVTLAIGGRVRRALCRQILRVETGAWPKGL